MAKYTPSKSLKNGPMAIMAITVTVSMVTLHSGWMTTLESHSPKVVESTLLR